MVDKNNSKKKVVDSKKLEVATTLLENYRNNMYIYKDTLEKIYVGETQLLKHEKGEIETREEIIERLSLPASTISDMPKSVTNKFNSATENSALNYLYYLTPSYLELNAIKKSIEENRIVLQKAYEAIKTVENIIESLSFRDRNILKYCFYEGCTTHEAMKLHAQNFPEFGTYRYQTFWQWKVEAVKRFASKL